MSQEKDGKFKKAEKKLVERVKETLGNYEEEKTQQILRLRKAIERLQNKRKEEENRVGALEKEKKAADKEHQKQLEESKKNHEKAIKELQAAIKQYEELVDQMQASGSHPPIYAARFLRMAADGKVLISQGEDLPPKEVAVKTAFVITRDGKQTVAIDPKVDISDLKSGQMVFVKRDMKQGIYTTLLSICPKEFFGQERVVLVKRVLDKDNALIIMDNRFDIARIGGDCEPLENGDRVIFDPECSFIICKAPQIEEEVDRKKIDPVTFKDVGGLEDIVKEIEDVVKLPFEHPEIFEKTGTRPAKSILFLGEPGVGKTLLARATANETDMYFLAYSGAEFRSSYSGEDIAKVQLIFDDAEKRAQNAKGAIIFIDEIESLVPIRSDLHSGQHDVESLVNFFFARMEGVKGRGNVIVIAATNQPDKLDPAARRRFDKTIYVPVPTERGRLEILKIHTKKMSLTEDVNLDEICDKTHGFVGNDIEHLCIEAALRAKERIRTAIGEGRITDEDLNKLAVSREDFLKVLEKMRPSGLGSVVITKTGVSFKDIAGLEEVKKAMLREVEILLGNNAFYKRVGMKARKGMLLVSWPGCGKTLLAKALASECKMNFIYVKGSEVHSMWFSMSERTLSHYFKIARLHSPSILFLDELDSILPKRGYDVGGTRVAERLVAAFNVELDGLEDLENVIVLAATNRLDLVDPAVIRRLCPSGKPIFIPPLNKADREEAFRIHTREKPLSQDVDFGELSEMTKERKHLIEYQDRIFVLVMSFNGDEIRGVCEEAERIAVTQFEKEKGDKVNECADEFFICQSHFKEAISGRLEQEKRQQETMSKDLSKERTVLSETSDEEIKKVINDFEFDGDVDLGLEKTKPSDDSAAKMEKNDSPDEFGEED